MDIRDLVSAAAEAASSLAPSAIGSAVAQAWKPGLPWRSRFLQWVTGSIVSFYATRAIIEATGWNEFVAQSIAFGVALVAFDATPRLMDAVGVALGKLPGALLARFLPAKD